MMIKKIDEPDRWFIQTLRNVVQEKEKKKKKKRSLSFIPSSFSLFYPVIE